MKLGDKELKPIPIRAGTATPAAVRLVVLFRSFPVAQHDATPDQVRALARELLAAADAAEGRTGG